MEQAAMQTGIAGQVGQQGAQNAAAQYFMQEQQKGLAEAQLEVDTIKEEIYHYLKQDKLKMENGKKEWDPLKDPKERTLTNWGVDRFMQTIHFYINKNTLLSNFKEEEINRLMRKFIKELNDLILLKYEVIFNEPNFEQCKEIILSKLDNKKKMKMFALEMLGEKVDEKGIEKYLIKEMEYTLEKEMEKIRVEQRREKIREYGLIIAQLEIMVLATLNRAWKGEERGSLRRHMNVTEIIGSNKSVKDKENQGGGFGWGRR